MKAYVDQYILNGLKYTVIASEDESRVYQATYGKQLEESYLKEHGHISKIWDGKKIICVELRVGDELSGELLKAWQERCGGYGVIRRQTACVSEIDVNGRYCKAEFTVGMFCYNLDGFEEFKKQWESEKEPTIEKLAKAEGIEIGMEISHELLTAWDAGTNKQGFHFPIEGGIYVAEKFVVFCGQNRFVCNGASLPIKGFKAFKEEFENKNGSDTYEGCDLEAEWENPGCDQIIMADTIEEVIQRDVCREGDVIYISDEFMVKRHEVDSEITTVANPKAKLFFDGDKAWEYHKSLTA